MNVRVVLRVAERHKTCDLWKSANFKKIPEMLGIDEDYPTRKANFVSQKIAKHQLLNIP